MLQEKNPETEVLDAERGPCCNGMTRGPHMTLYDFLLGSRRVEVKSARMAWSSTCGWYVRFPGINLAHAQRPECAFDDLYLVILSPSGLHLVQHDLVTGVCTRESRFRFRGTLYECMGPLALIVGKMP